MTSISHSGNSGGPGPDDEADCDDGILRLPPGDRSLAGTMQEGRDLMFAELKGVDLSGANFYWAMFHDAVLEEAS